MIKFINDSLDLPYIKFREKYNQAKAKKQNLIEAISIASYSNELNQVDTRFVNLKIVDNKNFIFFSNYMSPKAKQFQSHNQVSIAIFWNSINIQIRMKALIKKVPYTMNDEYFSNRSKEKNALAISSKQSKKIDSFEMVKINFDESFKNDDLKKCPEYWGGFSFTPYYFEFWEGHESRINKREVFNKIDDVWEQSFLQP
mgnify:CR=1 FL=1